MDKSTEKNNKINQFPPEIILWGGTGQAKVVRPIIEYYGSKVIAVFDYTPKLKSPFKDIPLYHDSKFQDWLKKQKNRSEIGFCVAIGNPHGLARLKIHDMLVECGLTPISLAHPSAIIAKDVKIGLGAQIIAGVIINPGAVIGKQCLINTAAVIDHECILGDGIEVSPGATLCGSVRVENGSWIAAGATVLPFLKIGVNSIVGAGAVVTKDVQPNIVVTGVPAKFLRNVTRNN